MKTILSFALITLAISILILLDAGVQPPTANAEYTVSLDDSRDRRIRVRADFLTTPSKALQLRGLVADRLLGVTQVKCASPGVEVTTSTEYHKTGDVTSAFTTYTLVSDQVESNWTLQYDISPTTNKISNPCGEPRHYGYVSGQYSAIGAANILLAPPTRLASVKIRLTSSNPRVSVHGSPRNVTLDKPTESSLWELAWVAGDFSTHSVEGMQGTTIYSTATVSPLLIRSVGECLNVLREYLGAGQVKKVVVLPRSESSLRIDLPTTQPLVYTTGDEPDVTTLRELVRRSVGPWYGRTRTSIEQHSAEVPTTMGQWFPLGLQEFLAIRIPAALGYDSVDYIDTIASIWSKSLPYGNVDFSSEENRANLTHRKVKALALTAIMDGANGVRGRLRIIRDASAWDCRGFPTIRTDSRLVPLNELLHPSESDIDSELTRAWKLTLDPMPRPADESLRIAFSSGTSGHLENCGCKINQEGGIARRAHAMNQPEVDIALDLGNFLPIEKHRSNLDELVASEALLYVEAMNTIKYDAVVIGPDEMYQGEALSNMLARADFAVLTGYIESDHIPSSAREYVIIERKGTRIGVIGYSERLDNGWLRAAQEPNAAYVQYPSSASRVIERACAIRESESLDYVIACGMIGPSSILEISRSPGAIDLILSGERPLYTGEFQRVGKLGETVVAFDVAETYGINVLDIELTNKDITGASLELIRLPRSASVQEETQSLLDDFYTSLSSYNNVDVTSLRLFVRDAHVQDNYIGSTTCGACHRDQYSQWLSTAHAHAMETLADARRNFHPKCVVCHVVGLGYSSGYQMSDPSPDRSLAGVGCENCHGSGGEHVADPRRTNIRRKPTIQTCLECHNSEHSDAFEHRFLDAYQEVQH